MVKKRATKRDWEEAALQALARDGVRGLAIPALARALGVTKGSFYWHFESLRALLASALQGWEASDRQVLAELATIAEPKARLRALFAQAMERRDTHALFVALSGAADAEVEATLRRLSQRRLEFLLTAYRELGLGSAAARTRALLAYSAYVGALHLRQHGAPGLRTTRELRAYVAAAVATLIP